MFSVNQSHCNCLQVSCSVITHDKHVAVSSSVPGQGTNNVHSNSIEWHCDNWQWHHRYSHYSSMASLLTLIAAPAKSGTSRNNSASKIFAGSSLQSSSFPGVHQGKWCERAPVLPSCTAWVEQLVLPHPPLLGTVVPSFGT